MIQDTRLFSTFLPPTSTAPAENGAATSCGANVGSIALIFLLSVPATVLFFYMAGLVYRRISSSTGSHVRKRSALFVVDVPPRYSEVFPPTYEWALQRGYKQPDIVSKYVDGADVAQAHLSP